MVAYIRRKLDSSTYETESRVKSVDKSYRVTWPKTGIDELAGILAYPPHVKNLEGTSYPCYQCVDIIIILREAVDSDATSDHVINHVKELIRLGCDMPSDL